MSKQRMSNRMVGGDWRRAGERGSIANGLALLLLLAIGVVVIVLWQGRAARVADVNVHDVGEAMADDLGAAAETVREESMDALTVTKVKAALALSRSVSAFDVDVDVEDGVVTLSGRLPSDDARTTALRIARDVSGVNDVVDRLDVVEGEAPSVDADELARRVAELQVKAAAYEGLLRAPGVDARRIRVVVGDGVGGEPGVVTLEGAVPTEEERRAAEALARSTKGVVKVLNRLTVSRPAS